VVSHHLENQHQIFLTQDRKPSIRYVLRGETPVLETSLSYHWDADVKMLAQSWSIRNREILQSTAETSPGCCTQIWIHVAWNDLSRAILPSGKGTD